MNEENGALSTRFLVESAIGAVLSTVMIVTVTSLNFFVDK